MRHCPLPPAQQPARAFDIARGDSRGRLWHPPKLAKGILKKELVVGVVQGLGRVVADAPPRSIAYDGVHARQHVPPQRGVLRRMAKHAREPPCRKRAEGAAHRAAARKFERQGKVPHEVGPWSHLARAATQLTEAPVTKAGVVWQVAHASTLHAANPAFEELLIPDEGFRELVRCGGCPFPIGKPSHEEDGGGARVNCKPRPRKGARRICEICVVELLVHHPELVNALEGCDLWAP